MGEQNISQTQTDRGVWGKVWLVVKVLQARLRFVAILAVVGAVIVYWPWLNAVYEKATRPITGTADRATTDTEYWCPMHPSVVRDHPGNCPVCGMPLAQRKKGDTSEQDPLPAGIVSRVQLTPFREAAAGIRTSKIHFRKLSRAIRTVGFVEFDERKLRRINARIAGKSRIDKLFVNVTGQTVEKDEPLAQLYSPDLVVTVQNLLDAAHAGNRDLEQMARRRLQLWGIAEDQINDILRTGQPITHVTIRSPIRGHVIRKYQQEGDYVEEGARLYDVVDLSTVWLEAEVYEDDIGYLKVGMPVQATTKALPNRTFKGRLSFIQPHLDASTRTLRVRFDMDNPEHELRPGMDATVRLVTPATELMKLSKTASKVRKEAYAKGFVLAVPEEAVVDTGNRKIVYRETEPDVYEGVEVKLGPRCGTYYPVVRGLKAGDDVATAGAFLIDAETRLSGNAASTYFGASGGPEAVKTDTVDVRPSTMRDEDDKVAFNLAHLDPEARAEVEQQGNCPVLGTRLGVMGRPVKLTLLGQKVFLCCKNCIKKAKADPAATVARLTGKPAQTPKAPATQTASAQQKPRPLSKKARANLARLKPEDRVMAERQGVCPMTEGVLGAMGVPFKLLIQGQAVFLCCPDCKEAALEHPDQTLAHAKQLQAQGGAKHD